MIPPDNSDLMVTESGARLVPLPFIPTTPVQRLVVERLLVQQAVSVCRSLRLTQSHLHQIRDDNSAGARLTRIQLAGTVSTCNARLDAIARTLLFC